MAIVLGPNRYGKAQTRLVRVSRDGDTHSLADFNVSVALSGDLEATHHTGDHRGVLPTDTMKNTVYAFAKEHGVGPPEQFGLLLARHFVATQEQVYAAAVSIEAFGWQRLGPHPFQRTNDFTRTAMISIGSSLTQVVSGLNGLVLLNSTASEFRGFPRDRRVLDSRPEIAEIRLALPNKHHYLVDLSPFDLANDNEVFVAGDRPYGLIEGTVTRDGAPPATADWFW